MTSSPGPGWWLAADGNWYPPESHPDVASRPRTVAAVGARVSGPAPRPSLRPKPAITTFGTAVTPAPTPAAATPPPAPEPLGVLADDLIPLDLPIDPPVHAPVDAGQPSAIDELLAAVDTSATAATAPIAAPEDLIPLEAPPQRIESIEQELDPTQALSRFIPDKPKPAPSVYEPPPVQLEHDPLAAVAAEPLYDYSDDLEETDPFADDAPAAEHDHAEDQAGVGIVDEPVVEEDVEPDAWDGDPDDLAAELEGSQRSARAQKKHERNAKKSERKREQAAEKEAKATAKAEKAGGRGGISALSILVLVALACAGGAYYWMFVREPAESDATSDGRQGVISVFDLGVGNCVGGDTDDIVLEGTLTELPSTPCSEPHQFEVFHIASFEPESAPFDKQAIIEYATNACHTRIEEILNKPLDTTPYNVHLLNPTEAGWAEDDRSSVCLVHEPGATLVAPIAELGN